MVATQEGANMKKRILCILLAVMMVLTGMHAPAVQAEEGEAVSNAGYVENEAVTNANININKTNFPDENFRNWIINNLTVSGSASAGYYMTQAQAESVTELGLRGQGIANAKGIEHFTNLTRLVLWDNELTSLDLSKNTKLTYLDLDNNHLPYLRLVKNTSLSTFYRTQSISGKVGAKVGDSYLFDFTKLVPKSYLQYVTLNDSSHSLNTSTGVLTLGYEASSFSYAFDTGNSSVGSLSVTVYIDSYTDVSTPKISTQPSAKTAAINETVSFSVKATGGQLKYQWQVKTSSSASWKNVSSVVSTKSTLSFTAKTTQNGYQYRCVIKNLAGSVTSKAVTLTVEGKPVITTQPAKKDAAVGETVQFSVKAAGTGLAYQWQVKTSSSASWKNISSVVSTNSTLTFTAKSTQTGYKYRCRVRNSYGTVYSDAVTLTVGKPVIVQQPASATVAKGSIAEFYVTAKGSSLKFQWYYRTSSSGSWKKLDVSNATAYQMTSSVLQVKATASNHGYQYRCVITNKHGKATSKTVTLLVKNGPVITTQPAGKTVYSGQTAKFSVEATGTSPAYQWQVKTSSTASWKNITSVASNKKSLSFTTKEAQNGYQYRCRVKNSYGTIYSTVATLKVKPITITTQPTNKTVMAGDTVTFKVAVSGGNLTYQWQVKTPSSSSWKNITSVTSNKKTLSFTGKESHSGNKYRCVIKNANDKVTSKTVTLTVNPITTTYRALLIGEENFNPICTRNRGDAEHMKTMLSTVKGPEGAKYTCTLKIDLGYDDIRNAIQTTFANTRDSDVSMFFIATHGNSSGDGQLATMDYSLPFDVLANWLNNYVKGKVIVILESCGSGSAIYANAEEAAAADALLNQQAIAAFAKVDEAEMANSGVGSMRQSKFYVLTASAHHQMSWGHEYGDAGNFFTDWLIEGIGSSGHMPADTNENNIVTLQELYTYIAQYDDYTFYDGYDYYTQQVQVYPTGSSYKLFRR